ncbi:MAG: hypothetical protein RLZZ317_984, partial [Actinomycetota bacterium]
ALIGFLTDHVIEVRYGETLQL